MVDSKHEYVSDSDSSVEDAMSEEEEMDLGCTPQHETRSFRQKYASVPFFVVCMLSIVSLVTST